MILPSSGLLAQEQVNELSEKSKDNDYIVRAKLQEKDEQISILAKKQEKFEQLLQSLIDSGQLKEALGLEGIIQ